MTSYQLKTQTIYCGDNIKMLNDLPDESRDENNENRHLNKDGEIEIVPIIVSSLLRTEQYKH